MYNIACETDMKLLATLIILKTHSGYQERRNLQPSLISRLLIVHFQRI